MPFSEAAIDASVTKRLGTVHTLPAFQEGYDSWRAGFEKGEAGVFTITIGKAVEYMEQAMLKGQNAD